MVDSAKERLKLLNELTCERDDDGSQQIIAEHLCKLREELDFKDQLLANLYTTNDFLKREVRH